MPHYPPSPSPPSSQGLKKDTGDGRAASFMHLLALLPQLARPPRFLVVENVVRGWRVFEPPKPFFKFTKARNPGGGERGAGLAHFETLKPKNKPKPWWWRTWCRAGAYYNRTTLKSKR